MAALLSFFTILSVLVLCSLGHAKPSKNSKLIVGSGDDTEEGSAVETPRPMTSKEEEELDEHYPWVLEREFGNGGNKILLSHYLSRREKAKNSSRLRKPLAMHVG